jgi:hypothetical protein
VNIFGVMALRTSIYPRNQLGFCDCLTVAKDLAGSASKYRLNPPLLTDHGDLRCNASREEALQ